MAEKQFNLGLLDKSIDDIEDLPGFETPVNGIYTLKLKMGTKVVVMKNTPRDCVEANFEVVECQEQNDPEEKATTPGTKFSMLFQVDNDIAMGKLKDILTPLAAHYGETNLGKLITETLAEDTIISAKVRRRADKEDKDKFYPDVSQVQVA